VLEPIPETEATKKTSILKPETEDVLVETPTFSNAESMVDQIKETRALKLMLDALANIQNQLLQRELRLVLNSLLLADQLVGYTEKEEMEFGDHSPLTTSGITTMVLPLSAETWVMVPVLDLIPEIMPTEKTLIVKPETEDVQLQTLTSSNAESMVDQTTMTRVLKLTSDVLEDHGYHTTLEPVKNSE
jgi:hypothetical protein